MAITEIYKICVYKINNNELNKLICFASDWQHGGSRKQTCCKFRKYKPNSGNKMRFSYKKTFLYIVCALFG